MPIIRGVVMNLDSDMRLMSIAITPDRVHEYRSLMSIVGIGHDTKSDLWMRYMETYTLIGYFGVLREDDRFHDSAVATYHRELDGDMDYMLSRDDCVHRRLGFEVLSQLLDLIETNVNVFWIDRVTHSIAIREFTSAGGRGLSLAIGPSY